MPKNTDTGRWPCFSHRVKRGAAVIFSLFIVFMFVLVTDVIAAPEGDGQGGESKPPSVGGNIAFQPESGTYTRSVRIRLTPGDLKSVRGDYIPSYICYTLDGSEPSRTNGKKYSSPIPIFGPGIVTLKARLLSKVGMYEGNVCSCYYAIRANDQKVATASAAATTQDSTATPDLSIPFDTSDSTVPAGVVTNLESLDQETRDEIELKTEKLIIDAPGITNVRLERVVRMQLVISNMGKARVSDISGFTVEPAYKFSEVKASLEQKFQNIKFSPPTINANPVEVRLTLEFNKIAKFYEKVIFEKLGSSE